MPWRYLTFYFLPLGFTITSMEQSKQLPPLKLNYKRTFLIGFAFFGILLLWQVYDSWCSPMLTELFQEALGADNPEEVQYLVGMVMALDNLAALIMLPIFGRLSDKTKTPIGKRMPYILIGTLVCAVAFPFIPVAFHYHSLAGLIVIMAIVVFFAMMYRNPAVALMPDITPKPLRSKANGIINIMGYLGGACATFLGMFFVFTNYLTEQEGKESQFNNLWIIMIPFLVASALMIVSCLVLFFTIKENKLARDLSEEMARGEEESETVDKVDDEAPMSRNNKIMLWLILGAEFLWFMADNGIGTFLSNYTIYYLHSDTGSSSLLTIVGGVASVLGFLAGGYLASYLGRKWTIFSGLALTAIGLLVWVICGFAFPPAIPPQGELNPFPFFLYIVWVLKGFGMSLVHVNSYPMVVELCSSKKVGAFTGYYYASSMAAQTITPCLLGLLLLIPGFSFAYLPVYAIAAIGLATLVFAFVKNVVNAKTKIKKGIESIGSDD